MVGLIAPPDAIPEFLPLVSWPVLEAVLRQEHFKGRSGRSHKPRLQVHLLCHSHEGLEELVSVSLITRRRYEDGVDGSLVHTQVLIEDFARLGESREVQPRDAWEGGASAHCYEDVEQLS